MVISCVIWSLVALSATHGDLARDEKKLILQSVFSHPSIQLHFYPEYLNRGKEQIVIVGPKDCAGISVLLFEKRFKVLSEIPSSKRKAGLYFKILSLSAKGKQAQVKGEFPAQGLYFEAMPVKAHGHWLATYMKDVLEKH